MPDTTHVATGKICYGQVGPADNMLCLEGMIDLSEDEFTPLPIAKWAYDLAQRKQVSVRYHITEEPRTQDELTEMLITRLCGGSWEGKSSLDFGHCYSELTGYLWTDETFNVGGHDVIEELTTYMGKYCHLILTVHE